MSKTRIKKIIQIDYSKNKTSMTIEFVDGQCYKRKMTTFINEVSNGRSCSISGKKLVKGERIARVSVSAKSKPSYWFSLESLDEQNKLNNINIYDKSTLIDKINEAFTKPTKTIAEEFTAAGKTPPKVSPIKVEIPIDKDTALSDNLQTSLQEVEDYYLDQQEIVIKDIRNNESELRKLKVKKENYGKFVSRAYRLLEDMKNFD